MKIHTYTSPRKTAHALCQRLIELIQAKDEEEFHLAIPGGSTIEPFYHALAGKYRKEIPWERIHLYWVDEVCVPLTDPANNYTRVKQLLLNNVPIPASQVHRIHGEDNPETEACRYSQLVEKQLPLINGIPTFDLVILGVGDDGHTSAVFPGQEVIVSCRENYAVALQPNTGKKRIAMTGNPTFHAHTIVTYITGLEKASIVKEILIDPNLVDNYAAKFVLQQDPGVELFLDRAALTGIEKWRLDTLLES